jgi:hypothetical protein
MSMPASETPAPPAPAFRRHLEEIILVVLVLLSAVGVAINDYSPQSAFRYWIWMAPTFGITSIAAAWGRAQRRGESVTTAIQRQIFHWVGVVGAVYLIYLLQSTGRMENEAAGLAALIVIALAAFLAGVHSDWRLMVLGVVLGVTVVGFAVLEQIIWVVVIPALLILLVAIGIYIRRKA